MPASSSSAPAAPRAGLLAALWWWVAAFVQLQVHNQLGLAPAFWLGFFLPGAVAAGMAGAGWGWLAGRLLGRRPRMALLLAAGLPLLAGLGLEGGRIVRAYGNRLALLGEPTSWAFVLATAFVLLALLLARRLPLLAALPGAALVVLLAAVAVEEGTGVERRPREELDAVLRPAAAVTPSPRRLLIFGVDGLDPRVLEELMAAGELPSFRRLAERGTLLPLATYQPTLSPLVWNTIATGWPWRQHGVGDFTVVVLPFAPRPVFLTTTFMERLWPAASRLLGGGATTRYLVSSYQRRRRVFWDVFGQAGIPCAVVDWWASHPARPFPGILASDQAFSAATLRRFHEQGGKALAGSVHPAGQGPGEEDLEPLLARILAPAAEAAREERVTRFYGGIEGPGSQYVDLEMPYVRQSLRAADFLEELMRQDRARVYVFYTRIVDTSQHLYWQFWKPGDPSFSSSPPPKDVARTLGDMIPRAHRLADALLGEMLEILGEDTAVLVLSDHGFHGVPPKFGTSAEGTMLPVSGHHWQGPPGVFLAAGPGILPGARVEVGVDDVLPALAWWLGLPLASNLPGRLPAGLFTGDYAGRNPGTVPTWEVEGEEAGERIPIQALSPEEATQLNQLGYAAGG